MSVGGTKVELDLDPPAAVRHGDRSRLEDLDDVGGLFTAGPVRSILRDRRGHLGDTAGPRRPAIPRPNEFHGLVVLAIGSELDRGVEVLEAAQRQGRVVAVEFDAAGELGRAPDVEARAKPDDRATIELDRRDDEIRAADPEGRPVDRHPIRLQVPAPCLDRSSSPQHRGHERDRVDADVDQDADIEERRGGRVPRLDPSPVHLGVDGPHGPEATGLDHGRGRLLGLAKERGR